MFLPTNFKFSRKAGQLLRHLVDQRTAHTKQQALTTDFSKGLQHIHSQTKTIVT